MKRQTMHPEFGPKHRAYIRAAQRATVSVAEGAVRAGKTVDNIAAFAAMLNKRPPDRIHLASGATAATAKLNIGVANGYGLENIFRGRCRWTKYRGNEALSIKLQGREYIVIFVGGAKADSFKRIRGNSFGMWIATEINLHHVDTIKEAFNRQLAAQVRRVFWDMNPSAPGAWIYTDYIDRFPEQFGERYNYQHFTIRDNATITPERLKEIEAQYVPGSVWYRRDIMGERCIAEGLVYPMFDMARHVVHGDVSKGSGTYYISIDYGTKNPTAMGLWRLHNGVGTMVKEYYYDGRNMHKQKTDEEYYLDLEEFAKGYQIERVIVDPSAASFKESIHRHGKFAVWDANNSVIDGIRLVASLLGRDKLKFHESCVNTFREFGLYSWDDKAAEDRPVKEADHCLSGDTLVDTVDGQTKIEDLVGQTGYVYCTDGETAQIGYFHDVRMTRSEAEIFEISLTDGTTIKATADHPILTKRGWIFVGDLRPDDEIAKVAAHAGIKHIGIISIKRAGKQPVYNMEVDGYHNFSVNGGVIVHNCMDMARYYANTIMWRDK